MIITQKSYLNWFEQHWSILNNRNQWWTTTTIRNNSNKHNYIINKKNNCNGFLEAAQKFVEVGWLWIELEQGFDCEMITLVSLNVLLFIDMFGHITFFRLLWLEKSYGSACESTSLSVAKKLICQKLAFVLKDKLAFSAKLVNQWMEKGRQINRSKINKPGANV